MGRFFNGTSSKIDDNRIFILPPITVCTWVFCMPLSSAVGFGIASTSTGGYYLRFVGTRLDLVKDQNVDMVSSPPLNLFGRWAHIGNSYDGTNYAFYLDGRPILKGVNVQSLTSQPIFHIGCDTGPGEFFHGGMSNFAMWLAVLTDAEVYQHSQGMWPNAIRKSSLQFNFPMMGPVGATEKDYSGNAFDATVVTNVNSFSDPPQILNQQRYRDAVIDPFRWNPLTVIPDTFANNPALVMM